MTKEHGRYRTDRLQVRQEEPLIQHMIDTADEPARDIAEWVADRCERESDKGYRIGRYGIRECAPTLAEEAVALENDRIVAMLVDMQWQESERGASVIGRAIAAIRLATS